MNKDAVKLIRDSGLIMESFRGDPNNLTDLGPVTGGYWVWYRFTNKVEWIKSEFKSHHKLLDVIYKKLKAEK